MFLIRAGLSLGLLVTLALPNKAKALPITTTLPPSIPRRAFLDPPQDLVFKDTNYPVEFQDLNKRPLPQQPHENVKYPRGWSTLSGDFYDPNFRVETNNVYYNTFNEHEGFYQEDEYFTDEGEEEETNHADPYPVESNNKGYTIADSELDAETDVETDLSTEDSDEERREGMGGFGTLLGGLIGGLAQLSGGAKPTQKPTPKPVSPANAYFPPDFEMDTIKSLDTRGKPPPPVRGGYNQFAYQPNFPPPPPVYPLPQPQEPKRPPKDNRMAPQFIEEPVIVEPEKPIFSRTTTVSKTTSWFVNNNNELVLVEDVDTAHLPLKVKYEKTSRTSSTGPTPTYLQAYEDVLFHEENEKGRTIIEKLSDLKGLNPTAITSYTNSPSLATTEFHEEVLFEEDLSQLKNVINEFEIKLSPEPIVLPQETYEEPPKDTKQPEEPPEESKHPEEPPKEPPRSHFFIDGKDAPINIDDIESRIDAVYEEPARSHFFVDGGDKLIDIDTIEDENEKHPPPKPLAPNLSHAPSMTPHYPQSSAEEFPSTMKNQPPPHLLPPPPPHPPSSSPHPPPAPPIPSPHSPSPPSPPHPPSPLLPPPPPPHSPPPPPPHSPPPPPPHSPPPPPPHSPPPPPPHSPPPPPHSPPPPPPHSPPPPPPPHSPPPPPHLLPPPPHPPSPPPPEASFPHQPSTGPKLPEPNHNQGPGFNHPPPLAGQHPQPFGNMPQQNNWELMGPRREPGNSHGTPEHPDSPMLKEDNRQRMEMRPVFPNRPNPNRPGLH